MIRRFYTESEVKRILAFYPHIKTIDLARVLKRPVYSVYNKAHSLGLKKSPEFDRHYLTGEEGKATRFQKGHVPFNKGRTGISYPGSVKTQFKKGHKPQTWVPIGTEVVTKDGYLKRKVTDDQAIPSRFNWKFVHVIVWERHHGPVPKGHVVVFKSNNNRDFSIENLECITRGELMKRNTIHNLPPEIKEVISMHTALKRTISRLEKNEPGHDSRSSQASI